MIDLKDYLSRSAFEGQQGRGITGEHTRIVSLIGTSVPSIPVKT